MFLEDWMRIKLAYKHKHQPKIHVWGDILKQGATQLVMFNRIMTATMYGDILSASCLSIVQESYPEGQYTSITKITHNSKYI